ncbi:MAG TPA: SLBB domain-containing protein [Prolixibacteraceae bacterium]|nr:SLBB domain-containing protein [Prolixibacteraceae bacterium]
MKKTKILIVTLLCFCAPVIFLQAQNPASIDINHLSERQIQQIVDEVNARGLTIDEAAQIARIQGASPQQIDQLINRIHELNSSKSLSNSTTSSPNAQVKTLTGESFSEKAPVNASPKTKRIFGFHLFNSGNLTFEPPVNIPTPQNYVLGIGDELLVSIWGASQQSYQLRVENNGAVHIPDIGPVYVSGMEFSQAKELIKKRLITIYQAIGDQHPNTFAEVSISNLRSIKINVVGEVMAPGTYNLPSTASAFNALYLSGGPNENGSFRNIQVIRDNKVIKTIDVYDFLINANTQGNIQLREQDIIYIPTYEKRVEADGAFKRNGIFELTEKESLTDLIRYLGGFTEQAFKGQLSLTRITDSEKKVIDITQSVYESFIPSNGDYIVASQIIDRYENRVNISGAVFRPGTYELTQGLTLSGLIKKAQGVKENYFSNRGLIIRLQNNLAPMTLSFNVDEIIKGVTDLPLQREDQVIIQDIFSMKQKRSVQILGEVQRPGEVEFFENMTLQDLIFKVGGFTEAASESYIELARRHNYEESNKVSDELVKLHQFTINRELTLENEDKSFLLAPFDYIYVRRAPSYHEQRTVYIKGEVQFPGAYSISSKNERISDLITRAGGVMPNAFLKGARMKRANTNAGMALQAINHNLPDSLIPQMEKQIDNDQLELRLESILKNPGAMYDYLLKEGDEITIPEISQEVRISGEVLNPIGMAYQEGKSLKYYINRSGGFTDKAMKRKVYVIHSDGTSEVTRNLFARSYPVPEPGCQIVIPQKPEKIKTDSTAKWLTIATTLSTLMVAIVSIAK